MRFTSRRLYYFDSLKMGRRYYKTGVCKGSPEYLFRWIEFRIRRAIKRLAVAYRRRAQDTAGGRDSYNVHDKQSKPKEIL